MDRHSLKRKRLPVTFLGGLGAEKTALLANLLANREAGLDDELLRAAMEAGAEVLRSEDRLVERPASPPLGELDEGHVHATGP